MININNFPGNIAVTGDDKKKKGTEKAKTTEPAPSAVLKNDSLNFSNAAKNVKPEGLKAFDKPENDKPNPWKIKSVHLNAGYVLDNNVIHTGPMRFINEANGTDVTIRDARQIDRKSWDYINFKGDRFAPDEPQFNLGVNLTFENNFGIEIDGKHNKIIMDGYDQTVHFDGTINGKPVNGYAPLNSYVHKHENTFGNMQISTLGTYTFDLPAPDKHKFSFITKAGPSLITTNTHSILNRPDGGVDNGTSDLKIVGYGGILENGIRYQFGPKVGRLGLEFSHSLSYLNYAGYPMVGGTTGSHTAAYNTFALKATVGLHGNKRK